MQAYVINLARSTDRRAHITAQLSRTQIHYTMVNGVDVADLDLGDTELIDPAFARASTDRPGVVGCALSHLKTYRMILDDGLEVACILEDDVVLPPDLGILTDAITRHMSGAEIVLLNFHSQEPCRITKTAAAQLPSSRLLAQISDEGRTGSAAAYLITREACARMIKAARPVRVVADEWGFFHNQGAIERLRCVVPMPVTQSPAFRTTMSYRITGGLYSSIRETIARSRVPILHQALTVRRRRHMQRYAIGRVEFVDDVQGGTPELLDNK